MPPVRAKPNTAFKPPRPLNSKATSASAASATKAPASRAPNASKDKSAQAAPAPSASTKAASRSESKPTTIRISSSPEVSDDAGSENDDGAILTDASPARPSPRADSRRERANSPLVESDPENGVPPPTQLEALPIPTKLLNKLLHEGFEDEDMRIGKEAMAVTGKYIDVFVREAMARAVFQRKEDDEASGGVGDGFLQVEDLEKQAPQLLLDF